MSGEDWHQLKKELLRVYRVQWGSDFLLQKIIFERKADIKPSSEEMHYKFVTPWLGLNTKNYPKIK